MLTTLEEKVDPKHAALLVVDMQNDFCHEQGVTALNGADVSNAQGMVPRLRHLIDGAKRAGMLVAFIRTTHGEWTDSEARVEQRRLRQHPHNCVEGAWGADWYAGMEPAESDLVVTKHRYSAFINSDLDLILRSRRIRTVVMAGTDTSVCVESTARDAFMLDYYVVFLNDCTASGDPEAHQATLKTIRRQFGVVCDAADVLGAMERVKGAAALVRP
ncbi:MAG: cysteine hydrolase [Dehalococcoidia bacterium]|nr:cysteine hydrolase [Dehalococcoidia bacterium]